MARPVLEGIVDETPEGAVETLEKTADQCWDGKDQRGLYELLLALDRLDYQRWPEELAARATYVEGTAASNLLNLRESQGSSPEEDEKGERQNERWQMQSFELQKSIISLRQSILLTNPESANPVRLARARTNLGNILRGIGRHIEALDHYAKALEVFPDFPMALGCRATSFHWYAQVTPDDRHRGLFEYQAYRDYDRALENNQLLPSDARQLFQAKRKGYEERFGWDGSGELPKIDDSDFGEDEAGAYRRWIAERRLFLNPLNDLTSKRCAAQDTLTLPSVTSSGDEGLEWHAFYNHLKQEFVSARYMFYLGCTDTDPHFSDQAVRMYNPLDYRIYAISTERVKTSFRIAYSLFDKISRFLVEYLGIQLNIPEHELNFWTVWFENGRPNDGVRDLFRAHPNGPLRGLFWIARDLRGDDEHREALLPDAQDLREIRNELEHGYIKLHDRIGWSIAKNRTEDHGPIEERPGRSLTVVDFRQRALRMMKTARVSLMYLAMAVVIEERWKARVRSEDDLVLPMPMDELDDGMKGPLD